MNNNHPFSSFSYLLFRRLISNKNLPSLLILISLSSGVTIVFNKVFQDKQCDPSAFLSGTQTIITKRTNRLTVTEEEVKILFSKYSEKLLEVSFNSVTKEYSDCTGNSVTLQFNDKNKLLKIILHLNSQLGR